MKSNPPKLFHNFFRWFCHPKLLKYIEGDLLELYEKRRTENGKLRADLRFIIDVLLLFRPGIIRPAEGYNDLNTYGMYKSYFTIGWRNFLRNKEYSFINMGGLAIGMAFATITGLWIQYEMNFDSFHKNGDRLALVMKNTSFNNERNTEEITPFPLQKELKENYPEVKRAAKVSWHNEYSLNVGENSINKVGRYVDPEFMEMFSFPIIKGDLKTALKDPNSIVITESVSQSLFASVDPIGKIVRVNNQYDLQVTAVIKDVPVNSTLQFDFLRPYEFVVQNFSSSPRLTSWRVSFLLNMVELEEGDSMEAFSEKISKLIMQKDNTVKNQFLFLHPLTKWHLKNDYKNWVNAGGRIEYVKLFGMVGIFVLLIACINFMNLSTARSQHRAREVGIRKTLGSLRTQLIGQFLCESLIISFLAFLLSLCLVVLLLPFLKEFGFENIRLSFDNGFLLIWGLLICVATGLVAGSYPALYLSSFSSVSVLKGIFKPGKIPVSFRRVLVVSQYAISIGLIVSTIAVFQQIDYAKGRSIGYDLHNLISFRATHDLHLNFSSLKEELLNSGYVKAVTSTSGPMTSLNQKWNDFSWDGKDPNSDIAFQVLMTEWDFEKVAGIKFKMGRPFSVIHASDSNAVILSESALKTIGYKDPIGRTMKFGSQEITIVGVIEDILILDPFKPVSPEAILFSDQGNTILVRVKDSGDLKETLTAIELIFKKYNATLPIGYSFVEDDFNEKFALENQIGKLAGIFAALAVFISCLGLFGLASFMVEQRVKEIGIRKILGASAMNLWRMLSKEFIVLVTGSFLIASPTAFYFLDSWLQNYNYRIQLSGWTFIAVGCGVTVFTVLTVSFQTVTAALANPVENLRSE